MQFRFGGYPHDVDEVKFDSGNRQTEWVGGNIPLKLIVTWNLSGILQADDPVTLTAKMRQMEIAYSSTAGIAGFFLDDGTPANIIGPGMSGVKVMSGPNWIGQYPAEHSTFRSYNLVLECEYESGYAGIVGFQETLTFRGNGGPVITWFTTINNGVIGQETAPASRCFATQSGTIIGYGDYLSAPPPLWFYPYLKNPEEQAAKKSGRRVGHGAVREYERSYSYSFEGDRPFSGNPAQWT